MPELPEVESTVRYLRERILGERFSSVDVRWHRTLSPLSIADPLLTLRGGVVRGVERRGKYIIIEVEASGKGMRKPIHVLVHLRMSGSLDVVPKGVPLHSHDRVVIYFASGRELRFNDTRKFGRLYVVWDPRVVVGTLGVEPLSEEFTPVLIQRLLGGKRGAIKQLLLNQTLIAGIGNIYADEALWRAGLHPLTRGVRVKFVQWELLQRAIQDILAEAIEAQGTDFGDGVVEMGTYVPAVYGREDEPCRRCASKISRIVVGQRGTHFCPRCQRQSGSKMPRSESGSASGNSARKGLRKLRRVAAKKRGDKLE
jgi:formamidopyrimidine-DNA glycosylase